MELLNLIINPISSNICGLCYKYSSVISNIYDNIEIHDEYFVIKTNLNIIMKNLFPSHELIISQACDNCSTIILQIFSLIQRSGIKNKILLYLLDNLNEEIDCKNVDKIKTKKCSLKVNIPNYDTIINDRHSMNDILCKKCPMKFKSQSLYEKHTEIAHKNINNASICHICGKNFNASSKLKTHLDCHKEKECPYCFKHFKSNSHFNLHLKKHKTYVAVKRNAKCLKCDNCDYQSINKCTLEAHINKVHLNIRPFVCQICKKGFYKKDNLSQHLLTHKKEKKKICYICGEGFVIERTLQQHLKLHSGQKPFNCDVCKMSFITASRRYEHIKRKHMDKNECCIVCGKKFSLKKDVNSHIRKVHGIEFVEDTI